MFSFDAGIMSVYTVIATLRMKHYSKRCAKAFVNTKGIALVDNHLRSKF